MKSKYRERENKREIIKEGDRCEGKLQVREKVRGEAARERLQTGGKDYEARQTDGESVRKDKAKTYTSE